MLYRLRYRGLLDTHVPSKPHIKDLSSVPLDMSKLPLPCPFLPAYWISPRPISDSQLHTLLHFHLCPIYLVVFKGSYSCDGISHLEVGFTLRCLQRLSRPGLATLPWVWYPTSPPAARPSLSSRTKDSSSQISYARAGEGPNCLPTL